MFNVGINSNFSMHTSQDTLKRTFARMSKKNKKNQKFEFFFFGPRGKKVIFLKIYVECIFGSSLFDVFLPG